MMGRLLGYHNFKLLQFMNKKIEIPLSKTKLILMLLVSILFIVLGIKFALTPEQFISFRFRSIEFVEIIGIITVFFCGSALIYILIKLLDKKPGLILDKKGITDNSSAVSVGLILWIDIISIRTGKIKSTSFLILEVKNPDEYIEKCSKFKQLLLKANYKMYGTPITISSTGLKSNFDSLEQLIHSEFEKYNYKG
jgi:hypothetical protein